MLLSIPPSAVRDVSVPSARVFPWCRSSGSLLEYFYLCDFVEEPSLSDSSLSIFLYVWSINAAKEHVGTFQLTSERSRIGNNPFLIHHETTTRTFLHIEVEFLKAFGLSREQFSSTWLPPWLPTVYGDAWFDTSIHVPAGASVSRPQCHCDPTPFDVRKVWCCGGYWSCQNRSERGGILQLKSTASTFNRFPRCTPAGWDRPLSSTRKSKIPVWPPTAVTVRFSRSTIRLLNY